MGLSDFTDMAGSGVTVTGEPLLHRTTVTPVTDLGFEIVRRATA